MKHYIFSRLATSSFYFGKQFGFLYFISVIFLCVVVSPSVLVAADCQIQTNNSAQVTFVGNSNITIYLNNYAYSDAVGNRVINNKKILWRDGVNLGEFTAENNYFDDAGLQKGQQYAYEVERWYKVYENSVWTWKLSDVCTMSRTVGNIEGTVPYDMTWDNSNGDWTLTGVVKAGTLSIIGANVVGGIIDVYGNIIIEGSSVTNTTIRGVNNNINISTASVKNNNLVNTGINGIDIMLVFEGNTGSNCNVFLYNRTSGQPLAFRNNNMPSCDINMYYVSGSASHPRQPPSSITVEDNVLRSLWLHDYSGAQFTNPITIRNNTFSRDITVQQVMGSLSIEDNAAASIKLSYFAANDLATRSVRRNVIKGAEQFGILLEDVAGLEVEENLIEGLNSGNIAVHFENIHVEKLTIRKNICRKGQSGLYMSSSYNKPNASIRNNTITDNFFLENELSVSIGSAGIIYGNNISNNFFRHAEGGRDFMLWSACNGCINNWNVTKSPGTNIAGGPYFGGNYWRDYTGGDSDIDGIGDTPYTINADSIDYLPLISPIIVNSSGDEEDADPNDGKCDVDPATAGAQCTLRAAITEVNKRAGVGGVIFDIPNVSSPTISPLTPLPHITNPVSLNAALQSGGRVVLDGTNAGANADGLFVQAGDLTVKGLSITGFKQNGIKGTTPGKVVLEDISITDNLGFGVLADNDIYVNVKPGSGTPTRPAQFSTISRNGVSAAGGGLASVKGSVEGAWIDASDNVGPGIYAKGPISLRVVKANNNKGPGIQSLNNDITIQTTVRNLPDEVSGNEGPGIMSGYSSLFKPLGSGIQGEGKNININSDIVVKDNAGWGIFTDGGAIGLNDVGGTTVVLRRSVVTGNGDTAKPCRHVGNLERLKTVEDCGKGGMGAGTALVAKYADVSGNNGPGIVAKTNIWGTGIKANNNAGPGIQSLTWDILILPGDFPNEVSGNEGPGIMAGYSSLFKPLGSGIQGEGKNIEIKSDITVKDNAGWGIFTSGGFISLNDSDGVRYVQKTSAVTGNGDKTKPCRYMGIGARLKTYEDCGGGGMGAGKFLDANDVDVSGNNGPGIVAKTNVTVSRIKVNNNAGPGIQSLTFDIEIGPADFPNKINEVSGNEGPGVLAGYSSEFLPDKLNHYNIHTIGGVRIENNAGWGLLSTTGSVVINAVDIVDPRSYMPQTSFISGNGDQSKKCSYYGENFRLKSCVNRNEGGVGSNQYFTGNLVEITANKGIGLHAGSGITYHTGKDCDNAGGNLALENVQGDMDIQNVDFCDADGDGVSGAVEDAGPNTGDANGDGFLDSQQQNVVSIPRQGSNSYITLTAGDSGASPQAAGQRSAPSVQPLAACDAIQSAYAADESPDDPSYLFPYGLIGFTVPCGSATVKLIFHDVTGLTGLTYRQYGPHPLSTNPPQWYELPGVTFGTMDISGKTVTTVSFPLTDGGTGDATGVDGKIIVQRGGLARLDATAPLDGTLTATAGDLSVSLTWTGFSDAEGGLREGDTYKLVRADGATAPADCTGTAVYEGADLNFTDTDIIAGQLYSYRLCAYNNAGGVSSGAAASGVIPYCYYDLTVTIQGTGGGTVGVNTGQLLWSDDTGSASYIMNTTVTTSAQAQACSSSTGFSGSCNSNSTDGKTASCQFPMTGPKDITATFMLNDKVRNLQAGTFHATVQAAYALAYEGDNIAILAGDLGEDVVFEGSDVSIFLTGGYDCEFAASGGTSTLNGLTIIDGLVTILNIVLQ